MVEKLPGFVDLKTFDPANQGRRTKAKVAVISRFLDVVLDLQLRNAGISRDRVEQGFHEANNLEDRALRSVRGAAAAVREEAKKERFEKYLRQNGRWVSVRDVAEVANLVYGILTYKQYIDQAFGKIDPNNTFVVRGVPGKLPPLPPAPPNVVIGGR